MSISKTIAALLSVSLANSHSAHASAEVVVRRGETLSQILQALRLVPLYGKRGSVANAIRLNPGLAESFGDRLEPGNRIRLPGGSAVVISQELQPVRKLASEEPAESQADPVAANRKRKASQERAWLIESSQISLQGGFEYFRLDATDRQNGAKSVLVSNMSPVANLDWALRWSSRWSSLMRFGVQVDRLADDSAARRVLAKSASNRKSFEAGAIRHWDHGGRTRITFGYEERPFQYATTATTLTLDYVGAPVLKAGHEFDLWRGRHALLGAGLEAKAILPARGRGYQTRWGQGARAQIFARHDLRSISIQGGFHFGYGRESSNLIQQVEHNVGATFGLSWSFD